MKRFFDTLALLTLIAFVVGALLLAAHGAQAQSRLFACVEPNGSWLSDNVPKSECLKMRNWKGKRGRWLPKDEDAPVRRRR